MGLFMFLVHWYMIGFLLLIVAGILFGVTISLKAKVVPEVENVGHNGHALGEQS